MKFVEFKKSLTDYMAPVYIFFGDDAFLIESCISNLKKECEISLPDLNLSIFNDESDFEEIMTSCETFPFMDKLRLVIAKDITITDKIKERIIQYSEKPNAYACLAIIVKGDAKLVDNDKITVVDCNKLDDIIIKKKVIADIKIKGYTITDEALSLLIRFCDNSLTRINSELSKLLPYANDKKEISEDMVRSMVVADVSYNIFELSDAILNKNTDKAIKVTKFLLETEEAYSVIGLLYNYFRRLLIVGITPSNIDNANIAKSLQVKPYAITLARNQCKQIGIKKLYNLCEEMQKIDLKIKNEFSNAENDLYNIIFSAIN